MQVGKMVGLSGVAVKVCHLTPSMLLLSVQNFLSFRFVSSAAIMVRVKPSILLTTWRTQKEKLHALFSVLTRVPCVELMVMLPTLSSTVQKTRRVSRMVESSVLPSQSLGRSEVQHAKIQLDICPIPFLCNIVHLLEIGFITGIQHT